MRLIVLSITIHRGVHSMNLVALTSMPNSKLEKEHSLLLPHGVTGTGVRLMTAISQDCSHLQNHKIRRNTETGLRKSVMPVISHHAFQVLSDSSLLIRNFRPGVPKNRDLHNGDFHKALQVNSGRHLAFS